MNGNFHAVIPGNFEPDVVCVRFFVGSTTDAFCLSLKSQ